VKQLTMLFLALSLIGLSACGGSGEPRLATVKIKGKLYVDDKLFGPCTLNLVPDAPGPSKRAASAVVGADGNFVLRTYDEGDGAVPGKYKVSLALPPARQEDILTNPSGGAPVPVPVTKPQDVEIAAGKPEIELKLEGTGETIKGTSDIAPSKSIGGP